MFVSYYENCITSIFWQLEYALAIWFFGNSIQFTKKQVKASIINVMALKVTMALIVQVSLCLKCPKNAFKMAKSYFLSKNLLHTLFIFVTRL